MAISNNSTGLRPGVCTSTTRPTNPYEGFMIFETDTDMVAIWNGSTWRYISATTPTNGTVLQIVESANDTTLRSSTTTTFGDTGLTLTITPKSVSSKILCLYGLQTYTSAATTGVGLRLLRGATTVVTDIDNAYGTASGVSVTTQLYYLDSPATTSATTYKIQFNRNQGAGTSYINASGAGVSRMLAMEISG
jgi:hypothetical protein